MRRLSRREKRLVIVLCGVAALGATSFYMAPETGPDPEAVTGYYVKAFETADKITIRTPDGKTAPVTVTRGADRGLFARLQTAVRFGRVSVGGMSGPPKYILDLVAQDGSETKDIAVGFTLDSPRQPARGKLSFVPREPSSEGPIPVMALMIEDYLDPAGAKARHERTREQVRLFMQQRGRPGAGGMRRSGRPGAEGAGQTPRAPGAVRGRGR